MRLPDDFWTVNEEDERVGIVQLLVAFIVFALLLVVILGGVLLAGSMQ